MLESDIKSLVNQILSSRKNANKISELIDLICITGSKNHELAACAVENAVTVFAKLCDKDDVMFESSSEKSKSVLTSVEKYKLWLGEHFMECYGNMLQLLTSISSSFQDQVLTNIMELLQLKFSVIYSQKGLCNIKTYGKDINALLTKILRHENMQLLKSFCGYFEYDDVRYVVLKRIPTVLDEFTKSNETSDRVLEDIFLVLKDVAVYMPDCEDTTVSLSNSMLFTEKALAKVLKADKKPALFLVEAHRKMFGVSWIEFLKRPLSANLRKEILIILHNLLIPNFAKPRLLADYLTRSFHQGGGLALLGLHGLFVLVNDYNLEYPDFFKNLYSLLHPRIFEKKYRNRFFNLLKQFLSSTHIPSYIVAAFVKKMSRLSLVAPPHGILVMLNLISSLIHTHPSIAYLINGASTNELADDPFLEEEQDLVACRAAQSSLWEVDALESHYLPEVAKAAAIVKKGKVYKHNIDQLLDAGYQDLIKFDETVFKSNAMNHVPPAAFLNGFEDIAAELWTL